MVHLKHILAGRLRRKIAATLLIISQILVACAPEVSVQSFQPTSEVLKVTPTPLQVTPLPTRDIYPPGTLVDYFAQTGDSLPALASHFHTTIEEIRKANPIVPDQVTTLPPGLPMKIPIYYQPFWGTTFKILPDSLFVYGPAQRNFDPINFVNSRPGWFKNYTDFGGGETLRGGELIQHISENYSVSPRLLLAILEFQTGALSEPTQPSGENYYPLGYKDVTHQGLYGQLLWAANALNEGYYAWRTGDLKAYNHYDGRIEHPDPWQNAVTVSIQNYFSIIYISKNDYEQAISPEGLAKTYQELFGDPWKDEKPHIPGSLAQPDFSLPFENGKSWTYTGGPHTGWGSGKPYAAIDFAPPAAVSGCIPSEEWVTAIADGLITRTDTGVAMLDVDGDGDERTGWVILYLHLAGQDMVKPGTRVSKGDVIGHPSCEGGHSTGTHVHIARRYNGEWMVADGAIPFTLEGWVVENGSSAYEGRLVRGGLFIRACVCSDKASQITAGSQ